MSSTKYKLTYQRILEEIAKAKEKPVLTEEMKDIIFKAREKGIPFKKIYEWLVELGYTGTFGSVRWFYEKHRGNRQSRD